MMKTLHLILKKKWFDMIKSGEKKEEYRDISKHWIRRLIGNDPNDGGFYHFDTVTFTNGYAKNAPRFVIELLDINRRGGHVEWGAVAGCEYFVLSLGDIIQQEPTAADLSVDWPTEGEFLPSEGGK